MYNLLDARWLCPVAGSGTVPVPASQRQGVSQRKCRNCYPDNGTATHDQVSPHSQYLKYVGLEEIRMRVKQIVVEMLMATLMGLALATVIFVLLSLAASFADIRHQRQQVIEPQDYEQTR